ncbi:MAG: Eco57I restriction-modification methylase domain-containing protein [Bacillota bacterium]
MAKDLLKKRLGQYFSGSKVAGLLVDLCAPGSADHVIDPMAGIGDMLKAVIEYGVPPANVFGIEIDPQVGLQCKDRISPGQVFIGDAFSLEPYSSFHNRAWDLVITNPPYVRYQTLGKHEGGSIALKSGEEVRRSLREIVKRLDHLTNEEKVCFQDIIASYSGLSDLAVPSWILCAALTRHGGQLAMVVPESWMSRDYALIIKYMLFKFFDLKYVVEDLNAAWFPDALVRTNLIVAERVRMRRTFQDLADSYFKNIRLASTLAGDSSLVERLSYDGHAGREAFRSLLCSNSDVSGDGFELKRIAMADFVSEMVSSPVFRKLVSRLEPRLQVISVPAFPKELRDVLGESLAPLTDIGAWGFKVGQGLRTGANRFFYGKLVRSEEDVDYLRVDDIFGDKVIPVSRKYSLPVLRYQSELSDGYIVSKDALSYRLLYIQEDFFNADGTLRNPSDMPLYQHIIEAEHMTIWSGGKPTRFPELTAVKPNIRGPGNKTMRRSWFMLPELARRHLPQLCISRVNHRNIKCFLVPQREVVVDANFSTLWMDVLDETKVYAMFALMNSLLIHAYLETIATIMGGGALKVEASHIRRLLVPFPTGETVSSLARLGKHLAESGSSEHASAKLEIDRLVIRFATGRSESEIQYERLQSFLLSKVNARQR